MGAISRRDFSLLLFTSLLTFPKLLKADKYGEDDEEYFKPIYEDHPISILQGMTDSTSTQFNIMVPKNSSRFYKIINSSSHIEAEFQLETIDRSYSDWVVDKVFTDSLVPGEYLLQVINDYDQIIDERSFSTLDLNKESVRCAITSCMDDQYHQRRLWQKFADEKPDIVFFVGDSIYADRTSSLGRVSPADPMQLWRRYSETRLHLAYYHQKRLIPTIAVWDDHDMGINNGDSSYKYKEDARQTFETFFAQDREREGLVRGPGTSSILTAFGQNFYFLDGRTFRLDSGSHPTFFGKKQEEWFFEHLMENSQTCWLLSGLQWFGGYQRQESFEKSGHYDFERFFHNLRKADRPIALMGGDIHFSEIMRIEEKWLGFETLELTSSSIHSETFWGWDNFFTNPRRIDSTYKHNFCILDMKTNGLNISGDLSCINHRSQPLFQHSFDLF